MRGVEEGPIDARRKARRSGRGPDKLGRGVGVTARSPAAPRFEGPPPAAAWPRSAGGWPVGCQSSSSTSSSSSAAVTRPALRAPHQAQQGQTCSAVTQNRIPITTT